MKYIHNEWYSTYGVSFDKDKENCFEKEITEEQAKKFVEFWEAIGCERRETSKYIIYTYYTDRKHHTEYIICK